MLVLFLLHVSAVTSSHPQGLQRPTVIVQILLFIAGPNMSVLFNEKHASAGISDKGCHEQDNHKRNAL
jgi:hypothetical protein